VEAARARTVKLANPLSDEAPLMRISILSTLVDALRRNVARGAKDVGLFELGLVVALEQEQLKAPTEDVGIRPSEEVLARIRAAVPAQPRHVGFLLAGESERAGWWGQGRPADLTDVLALAQAIATALSVELIPSADDAMPFHPGRCAQLTLPDGTLVGHVGELHPKVTAALGLPARTVGGELDVDALVAGSGVAVQAQAISVAPLSHQDIALVVDEAVTAAAVEAALRAGAGPELESLRLFDVYRGDQIGEGKKSLAYRLTVRAADRTLRSEEVSALRDAAVARAAADLGAVQRT
jgi:phenylalanyl-tRNA synthetase beta chain